VANEAAAAATVDLRIEGHISPKCEISLPNRVVQVTLTEAAGQRDVPIEVDCNQRLSVELHSLNGGLAHSTRASGVTFDGFANLVRYQATFSLARAGGMSISADSAAMLSGAGGTTGITPFKTQAILNLAWRPDSTLLGGDYQDLIEIRVSGAGEDGGEPR
jgi:hypothetical protein